MAIGMTAFFAVIVAVNVVMATAASRTFGGTVVDNSYVASQRFNRWLDEATAEKALGWSAEAGRLGDKVELVLRDRSGPLAGASVKAVAHHPLGRHADVRLQFEPEGAGAYRSVERLPAGRWQIRIHVTHQARQGRFVNEIAA